MSACPWDGYEPATSHFCEEELCAWIEQPANTWSNLAYVLVGVLLVVLALRARRKSLALIGAIEITVGVGSFLFHASSTRLFEVVDVGAMYLFSLYALLFNAKRLVEATGRTVSRSTLAALYVAAASVSVATVALLEAWVGVVLFSLQAVVAGLIELRLFRRHPDGVSRRPLIWLLVLFAIAWGAWWLDITGVVCDPSRHSVTGHAVWHLTNAWCFYFLYRFYAQLPSRGSSPSLTS